MSLDLYSKIEPYLGFDEEVHRLYREFLSNIAKRDISSVLDVGCGQGSFLELLRINGISSHGIDLSKEQIKACKEKGLSADAIDLCEIDREYECLSAVFDVINYIPGYELSSFIKCAARAAKKEGWFICDANTLFGFEEVAQGALIIDEEDMFIAIDAFFEDNALTTNMTLFEKQNKDAYSKEQSSITQYYHSKEQLIDILKQNGFDIDEIIEFNLHSQDSADKMIFVCKKR